MNMSRRLNLRLIEERREEERDKTNNLNVTEKNEQLQQTNGLFHRFTE